MGLVGFEPTTCRLGNGRAIRLRHSPKYLRYRLRGYRLGRIKETPFQCHLASIPIPHFEALRLRLDERNQLVQLSLIACHFRHYRLFVH